MKELKIMKALRYLLIVMGLMSVLSISGMVYSGSQLPSAAAQGTYVTGTTIGTYNPANVNGPHRAKKEDNPGGGFNPGGGEPGPGDNSEPWEDPLGDVMWPLLALAAAYALLRVYRRKRSV